MYRVILAQRSAGVNLSPVIPNGLPPSTFPTKTLYALLFSLVRVTFSVKLTPLPLDWITRMLFGVEYKSWSSSLYTVQLTTNKI